MNGCWYGLDVPLVLASRSPRRRLILEMAGIPFLPAPCDIDENGFDGTPEEVVMHWAREKATVASRSWHAHPVLGADTMVSLDGHLLGKPSDTEDAVRMISSLSGRWHTVHGGVSLIWTDRAIERSFSIATRVLFRDLSESGIRDYVATGEPMDKAGAYGIQGFGCALVQRIDGCYFNVMGLPISRLVRELELLSVNGG